PPPRPGGDAPVGTRPGLAPWAKAGLIVKASTRPASAYAAVMVTGSHGVRMQYDYTHDIAGPPGPVSQASPRWLRLTRTGDTITGAESADATHWTTIGTARLAGLPTTVQAGLFATSPQYAQPTSQSLRLTGPAGGPPRPAPPSPSRGPAQSPPPWPERRAWAPPSPRPWWAPSPG